MRERRVLIWLLAAGAVLPAGCGGSGRSSPASTTSAQTTSSQSGPEGIPLEHGPPLASASSTTPGSAVDGIECAPLEQLAYHIHAHLQVYVDGSPRQLPAAIGLLDPISEQTPYGPFYGAQKCYYWLHTHAADGVIHVESPTARIYTLGAFFDEWGQPLSADEVATARGKVTAFVDGKAWTKSPRAIELVPHSVIQLDVGSPVVGFQAVSWAGTNL